MNSGVVRMSQKTQQRQLHRTFWIHNRVRWTWRPTSQCTDPVARLLWRTLKESIHGFSVHVSNPGVTIHQQVIDLLESLRWTFERIAIPFAKDPITNTSFTDSSAHAQMNIRYKENGRVLCLRRMRLCGKMVRPYTKKQSHSWHDVCDRWQTSYDRSCDVEASVDYRCELLSGVGKGGDDRWWSSSIVWREMIEGLFVLVSCPHEH